MSGVELGVESWVEIWPEAEPLMALHHQAVVGDDLRMPFGIDVRKAEALDKLGMLLIVTARELPKGKLVGYCIWYLDMSIESVTTCIATQGPWYVLPEWRDKGYGLALFRRSLLALRERRIAWASPHHWMTPGWETLRDYFIKRLGAVEAEHSYLLYLGDKPC